MQCVCGLSRHDLSLLQLLSKQTRSTEYDKHLLDLRSRFRAWNTVPCVEHNLCRYSVRHKDLLVAQNTCLDFGPKNRTDPRGEKRDQKSNIYYNNRCPMVPLSELLAASIASAATLPLTQRIHYTGVNVTLISNLSVDHESNATSNTPSPQLCYEIQNRSAVWFPAPILTQMQT